MKHVGEFGLLFSIPAIIIGLIAIMIIVTIAIKMIDSSSSSHINDFDHNQKNKEKQITVVFEDKSTTDANEIVNIMNSLPKYEYTVLYEYDAEGYINKLILR